MKRTAFAVVALCIAVCLALVFLIPGSNPSASELGVSSPPTVSVSPAAQDVAPWGMFSVDIVVDPSGSGVAGGEVNVAFNPSAMWVNDIVFGGLCGASPLVGTKQIDNTAGTVRYALARQGATTPPTAVGTFATITFSAGWTAGTYPIDITFVGLADENFNDLLGIVIIDGSVSVIGPPAVSTNDASNIGLSSARLNGDLTSLGSSSSVTVSFGWGFDPSNVPNATAPQVMTSTGAFYFDLSGLTPCTTYFYRAIAVGDPGANFGDAKSFTTTCTSAPAVSTNDATNSGSLNADLTSLGSASSVTVSFEWGTSSGSYPSETAGQVMTSTGTFYFDLSGLTPSTTYFYRAKAVGDSTVYGAERSFTSICTSAPAVSTNDATNVTTNSGRLNGDLTSVGSASSVTVSFEWGTSSGTYPNETAGQAMTSTGAFYFDLTGLTPCTTYFCRAKAVGDGTSYGNEKSFTTACTAPALSVDPPAQDVDQGETFSVAILVDPSGYGVSGGELNIAFDPSAMSAIDIVFGDLFGANQLVGTAQIDNALGTIRYALARVGTTTPPTSAGTFATVTLTAGMTTGTYPIDITSIGLADENFNDILGTLVTDGSVTVLKGPTAPSVTTNNATVGKDSAILYGNLDDLGSAGNVTVSFAWGTSPGSYSHETEGQGKTSTGAFDSVLFDLTGGTTYYYRAKAMGDGTIYGEEKSFIAGNVALTVTTYYSSDVTTNSARFNGWLNGMGNNNSITVSFEWGTSSGIYPNETAGQAMTSTGAFYFDLSGLTPCTTYYYRAKAVGDGTVYGDEKSFTTICTSAPSVSTNDASNVTLSSARLNADLTSLGSASSVTVSFEWGTSSGTYPNQTAGQTMTSTGAFYLDLTGLTPCTTYFCRAKAVGDGTSYGAEKTFTTTCTAPAVSVDPPAQDVAQGSAFSVDIVVDPSGHGVAGGELNIAFDPSAMAVVDVVFGDLFGASPLVGTKQIDNTLGTVKFALARVGTTTPPTAAGIFATMVFTAGMTAGTYFIDITSIGLADENFADILGAVITDGSVTVMPAPGGTINVSSIPPGATFSITGPANYSGTAPWSVGDAPLGDYTIVWGDIAGYTRPADETQTLADGGTINFDGVYQSQWTNIFQDTKRGTTLYVNTVEGTFRLTGPDGYDTGVVQARAMSVRDGWIWIWHMDDNFHFNSNADSDSGYCYAYLWDSDTMHYYIVSTIPTH